MLSIQSATEKVAEDFVILKDGERPKPLFHGAMFAGGLLLLGLMIRRIRRSTAPAAAPPEGNREGAS